MEKNNPLDEIMAIVAAKGIISSESQVSSLLLLFP
jgi:hypothetical protein